MGLNVVQAAKFSGKAVTAGRDPRRRLLLITLLALLTLAMPTTAGATPPKSAIVSADTSFTNTFDCGFPLQETVSGSIKDIVYFDGDGNAARELVTAQHGGPLTVTWTNPANGVTLSSHEASPLMINYNPDGSFNRCRT